MLRMRKRFFERLMVLTSQTWDPTRGERSVNRPVSSWLNGHLTGSESAIRIPGTRSQLGRTAGS